LLSALVYEQSNEYDYIAKSYQKKTEEWEYTIWDDYKMENTSGEKYEEFLLSEKWLQTLTYEFNRYLDANWNIDKSANVDYLVIKTRLRKTFNDEVYKTYNTEIWGDDKNIKIWENISYNVDSFVLKHLKSWETEFNGWLLDDLTLLVDEWDNNPMMQQLISDSNWNNDTFKILLKEAIRKYSHVVNLKNGRSGKFSLDTWDTQLNLELRAYLFVYDKIYHTAHFNTTDWESDDCESELSKVYEAFLDIDDKAKASANNKYLKEEREAENKRLERDRQRRKAVAERNKSLNQKYLTYQWPQFLDTEIKSNNTKEPTWAEIIAKAGIQFPEYNTHENEKLSESWENHLRQTAFRLAWKDFLTYNPDIQELITLERMNTLYDMESNTFRQDMLDRFEARALKWKSAEEITKIMESLQRFSGYYENELKNLSSDATSQMDEINENITTQTAGSVLDGIKNTFSEFAKRSSSESGSNWFKFNENPVKKQWSELLISCNFSGTDITLRYDLKTGELFMNSFFQFSTDPSAITVWNEDPNEKIGNLGTFEDILDEYYAIPEPPEMEDEMPSNNPGIVSKGKWMPIRRPWMPPKRPSSEPPDLPDINELFSKQIDLMSDNRIKNSMASTSYKNIAMYKFLETFNILRDWESKTKKFEKSSNIYDTLNFIRESDSEALEYFNDEFMPKMMEYSGLERWINNMSQNTRANEKSKRLFDDSNQNNEYIKYLREKVGNFNPSQFLWPDTFDGSYQLKFADLIKEKLLDDSKTKLNKSKMEGFVRGLDSWGSVEQSERDPDEELEEQLDII